MEKNKQVLRQLHSIFKDEVLEKINKNQTDPFQWISVITKIMVTVESLLSSGQEKSEIIMSLVLLLVDESNIEQGNKEMLKIMINAQFPPIIENIILASKKINVIQKNCCCIIS